MRARVSLEPREAGEVSSSSSSPGFQPAHRRLVRTYELNRVICHFLPAGASVLEIGAGAGWQARALSQKGFEVTAIDVADSNYRDLEEWPVVTYDGRVIPLPDASVDIVFSSNVLEHIPHIVAFQKEILRVLKPGGVAVHIMPTATWRIATTVSFLPKRLMQLLGYIERRRADKNAVTTGQATVINKLSLWSKLRRVFLAPTHGVRGNVFTEAYYFSERYWTKLFINAGWEVTSVEPCGLFYTGNRIAGMSLSLPRRELLASVLGSSCKVYVLRRRS